LCISLWITTAQPTPGTLAEGAKSFVFQRIVALKKEKPRTSPMSTEFFQQICGQVSYLKGNKFEVTAYSSVAGGDINRTWKLQLTDTRGKATLFFVKQNRADRAEMFAAEAEGLSELGRNTNLRIPHVITHDIAGADAYLVLEHIPLGHAQDGTAAQLGKGLAAQHQLTAPRFGWHRDNTIGSTPQHNTWTTNWIDFYRDHRLGIQLQYAQRNGAPAALLRMGARLQNELEEFFTDYTPAPSLLHGDLWGGNWGTDERGQPVLFDPAVYYGDREADLAMTELFGGFPTDFYSAYNQAFPLEPGYRTRKDLYNLYHILNHFNLFGGSYASQALRITERLLAAR
jgi:protein-ribulosamine 3-kinase